LVMATVACANINAKKSPLSLTRAGGQVKSRA
jgi:hypothetical protein